MLQKCLTTTDITFDFTEGNEIIVHHKHTESWKVMVLDTGLNTMTGSRVKGIQRFVGDEPFFLTYGDAVSNVNIKELLEFHQSHGKCVTLTTVNLAEQKGVLEVASDDTVTAFHEKAVSDGAVINGGFMVCEPELFKCLEDDSTVLQKILMRALAKNGQLGGYPHKGFWQCMDTKREKDMLEELWEAGEALWKVWEE